MTAPTPVTTSIIVTDEALVTGQLEEVGQDPEAQGERHHHHPRGQDPGPSTQPLPGKQVDRRPGERQGRQDPRGPQHGLTTAAGWRRRRSPYASAGTRSR